MGLKTEWLRYGQDNEYLGYFAMPEHAEKPLASIIVFQEVWGVDTHIQDVTERFAEAGYIAFSPDLYAINGERKAGLSAERVEAVKSFLQSLPPTAWGNEAERDAALAKLPADESKRISETMATLFGGMNMNNYTAQLTATATYLREDLNASQGKPIAAVGFCMGGALAAHLAAHDGDLKGAVMFYGRSPSEDLISNIQCPVRAFYGELDGNLTSTAPAFADAMKNAGKDFSYKVYDGAHHAFFNDTRRSYNVMASRDAFAQTLTYFNEWLKA